MFSPVFNLRRKFITGLVLFALALGFCITVIIYFHFNSIMKSEISQRSRMLLAMSNAVQDYVKTELRPEMFNILPKGRFVLKAMSSSYISREVMVRLNIQDTSQYHYRRVSIKPRNPKSNANDFESGLIRMFDKDRTLKIWEDNTWVENEEYHLVARPVRFTDSCMQCHGDPKDAPAELINIYGGTNGFHYTVGEVGAVVVAGFPVDMIRSPVMDVTLNYLSLYLLGIMLFAGLISLFFDRLVMKNLHELTQIFKTRFSGKQEQSIIDRLGQKDEIEGLIEGVDELALCLSDARNELENYALNLEKMVEERTIKLHTESEKHLSDVHLFVRMLSGFSGSQNTMQLISDVLESVGKRFNADQVVYHCTNVSDNFYSWKTDRSITIIEKRIKDLLWKDEVLFEKDKLYIPIKSPESHMGILCITRSHPPASHDLDPAIFLALGQQMAILIENIQAFSNIRFQNDMLQSIFEGISDPLLLIDADCHIIIANKGSKHILANSSRENQEKELKEFLCQCAFPDRTCDILDLVTRQEKPLSEEIKTPDNRYFTIDLYPLPRQDQLGLRIVVYARDITPEKQMVERLQQAERLSAIGKTAAGIAHEINNPLGVIQCYTDLVKDAVDDPEIHYDIDIISKHTRTVQEIIQNLLDLSRPKQVISGKCSINSVVVNALEVFKTRGASKNISISSDLEDNLPDIKCDPAILEQILTNLWLNAFDAINELDGRIHISTRLSSKKRVSLCIEDNGPGIPEDVIPQIFDPFFTTKEVGKGTGLGLSVIYGFINELGGDIEVQSDDTTRFDISFPIAEH
jgi:two-component system NtrC family sensor kinase